MAVPGSGYLYSGGAYEIVEALIEDIGHAPFPEIMDDLVIEPAGMTHSTLAQPLPEHREGEAAAGHFGDGKEVPGRWRVMPEACRGRLVVDADRPRQAAHSGRTRLARREPPFLAPETAREITPQNSGPYGLGAAIGGEDGAPVVLKRGQNVGYQAYLVLLPGRGQGCHDELRQRLDPRRSADPPRCRPVWVEIAYSFA